MTEPVTTDFLVLRRTPYGDSRLIVAGISPDQGQISLIVPRPLPGSKSNFPHLDLFRLVCLNYRPASGKLCQCLDAELVQDFSALSHNYTAFAAACWLAKFTLANVLPATSHPHYFLALTVGLERLTKPGCLPELALTGATIAFLFEEGWLDSANQSEQEREQSRQLLMMSTGATPPRLTDNSWTQLFDWTCQMLRQAECSLPDKEK